MGIAIVTRRGPAVNGHERPAPRGQDVREGDVASPAARRPEPDALLFGTRRHAGTLEIHVDPQNERELESLLDTVTALMSRRDHDHAVAGGASAWPPDVSEREAEVLQLVAEGATAAAVALALHLSIHTVRSHIRNARRKLKSTTITQAVAVAILLGLVTPKPPAAAMAELESAEILLLDD